MRWPVLGSSLVAAAFLALVLLRPVLLAPVTGDDVYHSLRATAEPDRTVLTELAQLPDEWDRRVADGRVNVLTAVERRTTGRAMVETAVATGRPVHEVLAAFRIGYAALSLLAVYALLRAIRWRRPGSGTLVQMDRSTRTLAMLSGGLAVAVGAQPQIVGPHGQNGWDSYPVSTWTAAFSIFGVVALALWLSRLTSVRGWSVGVPAALLMAVVGVLTNYRYELTFTALPLTLLALIVVPVSDRDAPLAGRRAKALMGAAYVVGFVPVLVANRMMLSDVCASGTCYTGVTPALGLSTIRVFGVNVVSSVPGVGHEQISALLRAESVSTDGVWTPTVWSVMVGLALVVILALAWRGVTARHTDGEIEAEESRAQAALCVLAAGLLALGGLCAAAVMSLSERSGIEMQVGLLSRHTVVTWTGLAFALVLLVLAVGLMRRRLALPAFVGLALVMGLLVAIKGPTDEHIMAANAARMELTSEVFHEVVQGDTGDRANERRCRILRDVDRELTEFYARSVRRASTTAFQRFWRTPFCVNPRPT